MEGRHDLLGVPIGSFFGQWITIDVPYRTGKNSRVIVSCACGTTADRAVSELVNVFTKSCGCYRKELYKAQRGKNCRNWKGGRVQRSDGYVDVYVEGKYVREHRLVMEEMLGRKLFPNENVHHK